MIEHIEQVAQFTSIFDDADKAGSEVTKACKEALAAILEVIVPQAMTPGTRLYAATDAMLAATKNRQDPVFRTLDAATGLVITTFIGTAKKTLADMRAEAQRKVDEGGRTTDATGLVTLAENTQEYTSAHPKSDSTAPTSPDAENLG